VHVFYVLQLAAIVNLLLKKIMMKMTYRIHLKVNKFSASESYDNLPHVHCTSLNGLLARRLPLIHTLVRANVTNTVRIYLPSHPRHTPPLNVNVYL